LRNSWSVVLWSVVLWSVVLWSVRSDKKDETGRVKPNLSIREQKALQSITVKEKVKG